MLIVFLFTFVWSIILSLIVTNSSVKHKIIPTINKLFLWSRFGCYWHEEVPKLSNNTSANMQTSVVRYRYTNREQARLNELTCRCWLWVTNFYTYGNCAAYNFVEPNIRDIITISMPAVFYLKMNLILNYNAKSNFSFSEIEF